MIPFPKIRQYRNVVRSVHETASGVRPALPFCGAVKLHGTNTAVVRSPGGALRFQSRNRELTEDSDHQDFVRTLQADVGRDALREMIAALPGTDGETVAVFGEWCGQGIQQGVAISALPRMWAVFAVQVGDTRWLLPDEIRPFYRPEAGVQNVWRHQTWALTIDFERPNAARDELIAITRAVEASCPIGAALGAEGTGEGVVWRCVHPEWNRPETWFKVKGEQHSATRVRTLAPTDVERVASVDAFVEAALSEHRLLQALAWLRENNHPISRSATGAFLRWLFADIRDEEGDTMDASGLTEAEVNPTIARQARRWFFDYLDQNPLA